MTKNPVCATPEDSVEGIAHLMARQRFGGVPIVDAHKKLCGIISDSDIFKILVAVTGADCGGIQLAFELSDTPGALRPVLDALAQLDVNVVSILSAQKDKSVPTRRVFIRLHPLPDDQQKKVIEVISKEVPLLYWEPALEMSALDKWIRKEINSGTPLNFFSFCGKDGVFGSTLSYQRKYGAFLPKASRTGFYKQVLRQCLTNGCKRGFLACGQK